MGIGTSSLRKRYREDSDGRAVVREESRGCASYQS